jgi:HK97 family phage portal protein
MKNILNLFRKKRVEPQGSLTRSGTDLPTYWGNTQVIDFGQPIPMKISAVFRCVDVLSGSVASLALQVKRKKIKKIDPETGETKSYFVVDDGNPINTLLSVRPNSRLSAFDTIKNAVIELLLRGNAYLIPQYSSGNITSLTLLAPNTTTYDKNINSYYVSDSINNIFGRFDAAEIIHLRNVSVDGGYTGISTIEYAATVLDIASAADRQSKDIFQPGSTLRGFLSGEEVTTTGFGEPQETQLKAVGDRVESEIRSGKKIMHLTGSMKFTPLSMSPADLQLLESKKFTVLEICRFFGVHPDKVFAGQSTNYKASSMSQVSYLTDTLQPILRKIENEFTIKLIPKSLYSQLCIKFNMDDYFQTDLTTKSEYQSQTIQNGIYTVNEWRNKEGLDDVDGGDQTLVSCNLASINSSKIKGEDSSTQKL